MNRKYLQAFAVHLDAVNSGQALAKNFKLSDRLSACMTIARSGFSCEWRPSTPSYLSQRERSAYLRARDEMLTRLGEMFTK